jgi:hypothetical protein
MKRQERDPDFIETRGKRMGPAYDVEMDIDDLIAGSADLFAMEFPEMGTDLTYKED